MIRPATTADLAALEPLAREFYASSRHLGRFDMDRFTQFWGTYLKAGIGAVFVLDEGRGIAGTIGGVLFPEPYSGELVATEMFWFVSSGSRGGGVALYRAFERWARERGCTALRMVHLSDSMPEKLRDFYSRLGFQEIETHYSKPLREAA